MTSIEEKLMEAISQLTRAVEEANLAYEFAPRLLHRRGTQRRTLRATVGSRIIQRKRVSL